MPFEALVFYLESKFEYDVIKDNYMADMARYATYGQLKNPEKLPRYWDLKYKRQSAITKTRAADYTEDDVIAAFKGQGKLA